MGGGGDKQSNKYEPPEWTAGRYPAAMGMIDQIANRPYEQFAGQRVAQRNPWQTTAGELTVDRALYSDPQTMAARGALQGISQGNAANPYANDAYLDSVIGATAKDMSQAHADGTAAQTDSAAAMGGAFGGSLHSLKQSQDAGELAKRVGQMSNSARSADLGRKGQLWQQDVGNVMQAASASPEFSRLDQESYDAMAKYGGAEQNYQQSLLTGRVDEWQRQRDYAPQQADWLLSALSRASGQYGSNYQSGAGQSPWGTAAGLGIYRVRHVQRLRDVADEQRRKVESSARRRRDRDPGRAHRRVRPHGRARDRRRCGGRSGRRRRCSRWSGRDSPGPGAAAGGAAGAAGATLGMTSAAPGAAGMFAAGAAPAGSIAAGMGSRPWPRRAWRRCSRSRPLQLRRLVAWEWVAAPRASSAAARARYRPRRRSWARDPRHRTR